MAVDLSLGDDAKRILALASLVALATGTLWTLQAVTAVDRIEQVSTSDPWAEEGALTYEPLLADGTALPMGEPGYFSTDARRVRLTHAWTLRDDTAERVSAVGRLEVVVQHGAPGSRGAWTHREEVANATFAGAPGEAFLLAGEIDLPQLHARVAGVPGRDVADAAWAIVATIRFASAPNTAHAADESAFRYDLAYAPPLYVLPEEAASTILKDHTVRTASVAEAPRGLSGLAREPLGPALVLASLAGLAIALPSVLRPPHDEEAAA